MSQDEHTHEATSPTPEEQESAPTPQHEEAGEPVHEQVEEQVEPSEAKDAREEGSGEEQDEGDESSEESAPTRKAKRPARERKPPQGPDVKLELERLFDLSTKYPEVGAPLAKLAMKLGYQGIGERLIKMQLDSEIEARGVEFYRVSAEFARKEGRSEDVFSLVLEGVESVTTRGAQTGADELDRLLHLVRLGFVVLLFDREDLTSEPAFTQALGEKLPALESYYEEDPFFHTLLAQAMWFEDRESSEAAWERAVALRDAETTWNSRGTWYKEADSDFARAEWAYRSGLKSLPTSTLLRHNLAQVLMDRAQNEGAELPQIRSWLGESEALLRQALRHTRRHGMRRHINGNIERVKALQADLPKVEEVIEPPPEVGDVVRGRVRSFKNYGVFLALGRHHSGLLHISEIAHERIQDPAQVLKMGDMIEVKVLSVEQREEGEGLRIALSRKAILPPPEHDEAATQAPNRGSSEGGGDERNQRGRGRQKPSQRSERGGGDDNKNRGRRQSRGGARSGGQEQSSSQATDNTMGSLGDMLLAKLEEKQSKS